MRIPGNTMKHDGLAVEHLEMTRREAILLVHINEHFSGGFRPEDVAISLGWSTAEVHEALRVCAAFGFVREVHGDRAGSIG